MKATQILAAPAMLALTACSFAAEDIAAVPDNPTYEAHIKPLLADHCVVCHGARPSRGAPAYLRLDIYEDADGIAGTKTMARPSLWLMEADEMPPAAVRGDGVGPNGLAMFRLWVEQGRPER